MDPPTAPPPDDDPHRTERRLGEVAVELGLISPEVLSALTETQHRESSSGKPRPGLAQLLVRRAGLTATQLAEVVRVSSDTAGPTAAVPHVRDAEPSHVDAAPTEASADGSPRRLGKYHVMREVARGGMGVVYEALDPDLQRTVAIKVLTAGAADAEDVSRFQREGTLAARLRHPNIIAVHEVGMVQDPASPLTLHFLVMDYIAGQPLHRAAPRMSLHARMEVLETVARAVGFAHEQQVIHRDLKPHNILLRRDGTPVVTDFGLARDIARASDLTAEGAVMGTATYMAPEQVKGDSARIDARTDVWALGVILYELACGRCPFMGKTVSEVYQLILGADPVRPRKINRGLPPELETIALVALDKAPERRYQSAVELAEDLRRWREGQPITGLAPSTFYRLRKGLIRRKRPLLAILVASLVVAAAGLAIVTRLQLSGRRAALRNEVQTQTRERITAQLAPARTALRTLHREASRGRLPLARGPHNRRQADADPLALRLHEFLGDWRQLSWVSWSTAHGEFVGAYRVPTGTQLWLNRSWVAAGADSAFHYTCDGRALVGPAAEPPYQAPPGYDPRVRPFYELASGSAEAAWTEPYVFWGAYPGISCVQAVRDAGGQLRGVLTVDFEIWGLSRSLRELTVGQSGQKFPGTVVVFTPKGKLVAHSREAVVARPEQLTRGQGDAAELLDAGQIPDAEMRLLIAHLGGVPELASLPRELTFSTGGRDYLASLRAHEVAGKTLIAALLVPADDPVAMPASYRGMVVASWSCGGLALLVLLGAGVARWLGRR